MDKSNEDLDNLIHRFFRLYHLSNSAMEKDEFGLKIKNLIRKRKETNDQS
ncbi:hypothetical protein ABER99_20365 [Paenibacillus glucanolyticus]|jgi:hypothetical protein|nr:hypothetical protein [Paenibacillus glucanolyticus]